MTDTDESKLDTVEKILDGKLIIKCDRCKQWVEGEISDTFTSGVYDVSGYWSRCGNPGEYLVCEKCMWADERFLLRSE